jgi:UDP-N-acetylmuramoyl-L-alanyl-D-glutamate--2,6-diaminopimelate ligase
LIGNHNVSNILAALSVAILKKIPMHLIKGAIKDFKGVKGRFEKVNNQKDLNIFVDFAHTPDAMENVLQILKELKTQDSKIINVFGCGGDRDKIKRPLMAKVSEKYSDITIVTSDNPRNEDPDAIIQDIIKGFSKDFNFIIENDRKKAIEKSIKLAKVQDIIIITGKGHETNQIINNISYDFDDVEIAKSLCTDL